MNVLELLYSIQEKWGQRASDESPETVASWFNTTSDTVENNLNDPDYIFGYLFADAMVQFSDEFQDEYYDRYVG